MKSRVQGYTAGEPPQSGPEAQTPALAYTPKSMPLKTDCGHAMRQAQTVPRGWRGGQGDSQPGKKILAESLRAGGGQREKGERGKGKKRQAE